MALFRRRIQPEGEKRCSFCHKSEDVVGRLISSPTDYDRAYICDECVLACSQVVEGQLGPIPGHYHGTEGYRPFTAIEQSAIPVATEAAFQHIVDTYASETNKLISTWRVFSDEDLDFRPRPSSSTVQEIFKHELLSGRRFFSEFLASPEPDGGDVLPPVLTVEACCERMTELVRERLPFLASRTHDWWLTEAPFFDVTRQRIWIFWRRVLHTAHHRTQLTVYLRLLNKPVPPIYGPTADVSWSGADPTHTVEASERLGTA